MMKTKKYFTIIYVFIAVLALFGLAKIVHGGSQGNDEYSVLESPSVVQSANFTFNGNTMTVSGTARGGMQNTNLCSGETLHLPIYDAFWSIDDNALNGDFYSALVTTAQGQNGICNGNSGVANELATLDRYSYSFNVNISSLVPGSQHTILMTTWDSGDIGSGSVWFNFTVPAAPAPTVSISANPSTIILGNSTTLTWSSTNATSCTGVGSNNGGWNGSTRTASGSSPYTTTPGSTGSAYFELDCSGPGGSGSASTTVTVNAPAVPTAWISASPTAIFLGNPTTLTWSSNNADYCTGVGSNNGGWNGSTRTASGSSPYTTTPGAMGTAYFELDCYNDNGQQRTSPSVSVSVLASIGGNISGLSGSVTLTQTGNGNTLTTSSNGGFTFGWGVPMSSGYNVVVSSQPANQTCTVSNGSGMISSSDIANVAVNCVNNAATIAVGTNLPNTGNSLYGTMNNSTWYFQHNNITDPCTTANCVDVTRGNYTASNTNGSSNPLIFYPDNPHYYLNGAIQHNSGGYAPIGYNRGVTKSPATALTPFSFFMSKFINVASADDCGYNTSCTINAFTNGNSFTYNSTYTGQSCSIVLNVTLNGTSSPAPSGLGYTITSGGVGNSGSSDGTSNKTILGSAPTNGNIALDSNGNIIYELDSNGNQILSGGQPIAEIVPTTYTLSLNGSYTNGVPYDVMYQSNNNNVSVWNPSANTIINYTQSPATYNSSTGMVNYVIPCEYNASTQQPETTTVNVTVQPRAGIQVK